MMQSRFPRSHRLCAGIALTLGGVLFQAAVQASAAIPLSSLNGCDGFRLDGIGRNDNTGRDVSAAGDVNGDGIDDLIIGNSSVRSIDNMENVGASYVVFGNSTPTHNIFASGFEASGCP